MNNLTTSSVVLSAHFLAKTFAEGDLCVEVLRSVTVQIKAGEMVAIVGPSGSGKSTLLHILGGLDQPTSGTVMINGIEIDQLSATAKGELRNKYLGFVYQFHHLLPEFTALENVCMPLLIGGVEVKVAIERARMMLAKVELSAREQHRPAELSGGERQRVALARALVNNPQCVLADEPTGNLDHKTAEKIYDLIATLNHELKIAFVIVTHDLNVARRMNRVLTLQDGILNQF